MKNLLKLEYRKLRKQKSFYICMSIMALLLFLSALATKLLLNLAASLSEEFAQITVLPTDFLLDTPADSSFILIISIFPVLTVCDDFEQQTVKNIYARGYSRPSVYMAKLISLFTSASFMFFVMEILSLCFSILFFGTQELNTPRLLPILAVQYFTIIAEVSLFSAVSFLFRRIGVSIAVVIIGPMLIDAGLAAMDFLIRSDSFSLENIWLSSFLSDLSILTVDTERLLLCLAASLLYTAVFIGAGFLFSRKVEV